MLKKEYSKNYLILIILATVFVGYFYGPVIIAPNDYLFEPYGDGLNQYFNFSYYVKHGGKSVDNQGILYPYGEHYIYTDGQPIFALLSNWLSLLFPSIKNYPVGILNFLMILSLWLTPLLLFSIMAKLKIKPSLALIGALGITFLEPQLFRMRGHFSLSYSCVFPLTIYILLQIHQSSKKQKWIAFLIANNCLWLFIHPYIGLSTCLVSAAFWFFNLLWNFKEQALKGNTYVFPFLTFLTPIVLFKLLVSATDTHLNKPDNVYGLLSFCGEPDDIFVANFPPLSSLINNVVKIQHTWEGQAYVGIATILVLLISLITWTIRRIKKQGPFFTEKINPVVWIALWASIPFLLLSWAFPFKQFPILIEYTPFLKQFRALGRFAWIFYYVSTLFSIYIIHLTALKLELNNKKGLATALIIIVPLLYLIEGYEPQRRVAFLSQQHKNYFIPKYQPAFVKEAISKINIEDYQAILPLPLFYIGSGNFNRPFIGGSMQLSLLTSYETGIPILGGGSARGDVWESRNTVEIIAPSYYKKNIVKDIPNEKPFLITLSRNKLTPYEKEIINRATLISKDEHGQGIYSISKNKLFANSCNWMLKKFKEKKETLYPRQENYLTSDSSLFFFTENFNQFQSKYSIDNKGALNGSKKESHLLCNISPNNIAGKKLHASFWTFNGEIDAVNFFKVAAHIVHKNGKIDTLDIVRPDYSAIINGDWSMSELTFKVPKSFNPKNQSLKIRTYPSSHTSTRIYIDNLLIKETYGNIYKIMSVDSKGLQELMYNNHQIIRQD